MMIFRFRLFPKNLRIPKYMDTTPAMIRRL